MPSITFIPNGSGENPLSGLATVAGLMQSLQQSQTSAALAQSQLQTQALQRVAEQQQIGFNAQREPLLLQGLQNQNKVSGINSQYAEPLAKANLSLVQSQANSAKIEADNQQALVNKRLELLSASVDSAKADAESKGLSNWTAKMTFLPRVMGAYKELATADSQMQANLAHAGMLTAQGALLKAQSDKDAPDAILGQQIGQFASDPSVSPQDRIATLQWYHDNITNKPDKTDALNQLINGSGKDAAAGVRPLLSWMKARGRGFVQNGPQNDLSSAPGTSTIALPGQDKIKLDTRGASKKDVQDVQSTLSEIGGINQDFNDMSSKIKPVYGEGPNGEGRAYWQQVKQENDSIVQGFSKKREEPLNTEINALAANGDFTRKEVADLLKPVENLSRDKATVYKKLAISMTKTARPDLLYTAFVKQYGEDYLGKPALQRLFALGQKVTSQPQE